MVMVTRARLARSQAGIPVCGGEHWSGLSCVLGRYTDSLSICGICGWVCSSGGWGYCLPHAQRRRHRQKTQTPSLVSGKRNALVSTCHAMLTAVQYCMYHLSSVAAAAATRPRRPLRHGLALVAPYSIPLCLFISQHPRRNKPPRSRPDGRGRGNGCVLRASRALLL